jgi:hypothetical protein
MTKVTQEKLLVPGFEGPGNNANGGMRELETRNWKPRSSIATSHFFPAAQ